MKNSMRREQKKNSNPIYGWQRTHILHYIYIHRQNAGEYFYRHSAIAKNNFYCISNTIYVVAIATTKSHRKRDE